MKIILLQIMLSMVFFLITPLASPQGKEFERTRSFDWQKPLVGEDAEVEYKLAIGDQINVSVWRNPELSGTRTINPDGKVSFPLIGTIKASDLTIEEFRENLR
ncbi:MAG: polysaccharide biosynthesis/export family protein, partial [Candidatus Omnitrophica bacterium]|nr:polysaccharide biosynthesis/export family protein [Candidatus Omnitrophota bacterium]